MCHICAKGTLRTTIRKNDATKCSKEKHVARKKESKECFIKQSVILFHHKIASAINYGAEERT
jgi:hypothetical protein